MKRALRKPADIHAMQVKLAFQRIYLGAPAHQGVLTLLERCGYIVSAMFSVSQDHGHPTPSGAH